jgi:hypothetical protein
MSKPAATVQKQKKPTTIATIEVPEPKRVKQQTWILRAVNDNNDKQRFFEVDELEQAKQWLLDQYINDNASYPHNYFIERCTTDDSEPYKMFTLSRNGVIWMNNERTMKQLQSSIANDNSVIGISDISLQRILEYLEKNKLKLKIEKIEPKIQIVEDSDSDLSDSDLSDS